MTLTMPGPSTAASAIASTSVGKASPASMTAHDHVVDLGEEARDRADGDPKEARRDDDGEADEERDVAAVDDAREDVPPKLSVPNQCAALGGLEAVHERRLERPDAVRNGPIAGHEDDGGEDGPRR